MKQRHDCKWTPAVLLRISEIMNRHEIVGNVHDPYAGIAYNVLVYLATEGRRISGCDIEPEFAAAQPWIKVGDALSYDSYPLDLRSVFTSITFANRMAGSHVGSKCQHCEGKKCEKCNWHGDDRDRRHGYAPSLGRPPSEGSSALWTFGKKWKEFHTDWFTVCAQLFPPGHTEAIILNIKDSFKTAKTGEGQSRVYVTDWVVGAARDAGFVLAEAHSVDVPSNSRGQNGEARLPFESVLVFDRMAA